MNNGIKKKKIYIEKRANDGKGDAERREAKKIYNPMDYIALI